MGNWTGFVIYAQTLNVTLAGIQLGMVTTHQLILTPHGRLLLEASNGDGAAAAFAADDELTGAFAEGSARGLLALAARRREAQGWPAEWMFWRELADAYLAALAHAPEPGDGGGVAEVAPPAGFFFALTLRIPAMRGAEYASPEVFAALWRELDTLARTEAQAAGGLKPWLGRIRPALHLLGKVTFHLAENKRSPETPFAFMATYTHRLSAQEKPVHLPLGRALQEYAGAKNQVALRSLLEPVQQAAERSAWTRDLLDSKRIFQPQAWTPAHAYAFLREVPALESSGIITRIPDWWKNRRGTRPQVSVRVGGAAQGAGLGVDSMLNFSVESTLGGEPLTAAEWKALMSAEAGLVSLRGQWVEVDGAKLTSVMDHWKRVAAGAAGDGVSFLEGMRLLSGVKLGGDAVADEAMAATADWSEVVAGGWLRETLEKIRQPESAASFDPNENLHATLRPYQATGVKWLWLLQSLGLGACLADDMGLGKTIQVIALLLRLKHGAPSIARHDGVKNAQAEQCSALQSPTLLIAPASLLANWKNELARFAPTLRAGFAHPAEAPGGEWRDAKTADAFLAGKDIILTTYGQAARLEWMAAREWRLLVLDEAQAIKNPGARQTRAIKRLRARARIALSGTPVENRLGDLWSLYDFLNPGLLGAAPEFTRYVKNLQAAEPPNFAPLRQLAHAHLVKRGLLFRERAPCVQLGLVRQIGNDGAVGLEPAQQVRPHEPAQRREVGRLRGLQRLDAAAEFRRGAEQAGIEEIVERPQVAEAVFDRRAAERDARSGAETLDRAGLPRAGIFDRLRFVENDEPPLALRDPIQPRGLPVGGEDKVPAREKFLPSRRVTPLAGRRLGRMQDSRAQARGEPGEFVLPIRQQ